MTRKMTRAPLRLSDVRQSELEQLAGSQTAAPREVQRAQVLLAYAQGKTPTEIQRAFGVSRPTIYKCIDKALAAGVQAGPHDKYHRPRTPEISDEAKRWVIRLACRKPRELGLADELWTLSALAEYVAAHAWEAGFPRLARTGKTMVWRILQSHELKPDRARYHLRQRDARLERKQVELLMLYRDARMVRAEALDDRQPQAIYAVDANEKPDVQPDGASLSILAALDLHGGQMIVHVEPRRRSAEFIGLLRRLDQHYPGEALIRIALDKHGAHIAKETMAYLASRPGRFEYVHAPEHGAWLDLVESVFSRMVGSVLGHVRAASLDELRQRIQNAIDDVSDRSIRSRWASSGTGTEMI